MHLFVQRVWSRTDQNTLHCLTKGKIFFIEIVRNMLIILLFARNGLTLIPIHLIHIAIFCIYVELDEDTLSLK